MSIDNLKIINIQGIDTNFTRFDIDSRFSLMERLVALHEPTILLLDDPYDGNLFKASIFQKYETVTSDINQNIVMLYDANRVSATKQRDIRPDVQYLNFDNIVIPNFEVLSPQPMQEVINRFACLTWTGANIYEEENKRKSYIEQLISLSQAIAMTRNLPILMGGDFKFPISELKKLVNSRNQSAFSSLREDTQPMFEQFGIGLASQVDYQLGRPKRLLTMKVHEIPRHNGTISKNDCFVASQELRLRAPSFINIDELWSTAIYLRGEKECNGGKPLSNQTTMNGHCERPSPAQFCPTKTDIYVPQRPPRHHGG
ncbi:hypothetical protein CHS0354_025937 [Potamilus streckersoni]|uniref:Uncharacterized protein n=1 Tax=Potamilus streckersoni TaxID=2493646 RepID=A0AAE0W7R7_9BIVA|nr:hypothetical protein CHS0354_025937 [Potamilus streckersoni]